MRAPGFQGKLLAKIPTEDRHDQEHPSTNKGLAHIVLSVERFVAVVPSKEWLHPSAERDSQETERAK